MSIRVLVADDHAILREGLRALFAEVDDVELVGEAADGREAVRLAEEIRPDVVIMDIAMPGLNGAEATRRIVDSVPGVKVVALSIHADDQFVRRMLMAGAAGFCRKGCSFDELVKAIRAVVDDRSYLGPQAARAVTDDYARSLREGRPGNAHLLTGREREILQLLAEGHRPKEIATMLDISEKTVSSHRRNLMDKLDASSLADVVKYAIRMGFTSLEE